MLAEYLSFARSHPRPLAFGLLLASLSSFGQTFFIALSGAGIRADFGISDGQLGLSYAAATLASGFALGWAGRWIDRVTLRHYTLGATLLLALGCVAMALVPGVWALPAAFFLLRIAGQGLLTHTAMTATARRFGPDRGKALALVALGFALGEAALPPMAVGLLPWIGWRGLWWCATGALLIGAWLALRLLPRSEAAPPSRLGSTAAPRPPSLWRDHRLWLVMPAILAPSFVVTGFFFHQLRLAMELNWDLGVVAGAFAGYALARAGAMLRAGPVIDRIGATPLLPVFLLPLTLAMVAIVMGSGSQIAAVSYLVLAGLTSGVSTTMTTAMWTEFYGLERLGAVRAAVAGAGVIASALAPAAFGWLLDLGITLHRQALWSLFGMVLAALLTLPVSRPWRRGR
ncbi:MFS transporter [Falsiroseomonas tokyonensis]|uniref:MFS transporter n=1 Tax=Falsiroseomonas tokyonensis TaxID=430521 RepID=A0ABV7C1G4_9PROT|nr:MFS transporter [Falsiroseomonas tokyonensis]MBU8541640.1 MFS transporter [Falsiroseomonas tokyonensis]